MPALSMRAKSPQSVQYTCLGKEKLVSIGNFTGVTVVLSLITEMTS